jgi:alkylhydroperoxidase/carboxymuconolactone decarboxylase family protein YurZ
MPLVQRVNDDPDQSPVSGKMKQLLKIAAKIKVDGREVTSADVASARAAGATDLEIHDAVLIAAAFCMYNRYVDGLATVAPGDPALYAEQASQIIADGYQSALR